MPLAIRRIRTDPDEIEALARLRHAAFFAEGARTLAVERAELAAFARRDSSDEAGLVAELDGGLAGCSLLVPREIDQHHDCGPWLAGLAVEPGLRSRGIGSALVRAIEDEAGQRGIARLFLYTSGAKPFYAARGWFVLDDFVDGDGEASTLMAKDIAERAAPR
jgi:predicted N-acetyltransferase YhbS